MTEGGLALSISFTRLPWVPATRGVRMLAWYVRIAPPEKVGVAEPESDGATMSSVRDACPCRTAEFAPVGIADAP